MKKAFLIIVGLFVMSFAQVALPSPAAQAAFDFKGGVDCNDQKNANSTVCSTQTPGDDPLSGDNGLLIRIADIVAFVAGAAAIIIILIGSIRYVTSGGDSNKISSAKHAILGALIGILIVALARTIIYFVVNRI